MCRHPLGEPLVLRLDDAVRQVAVGGAVPPETVDGQCLYVDPRLVHELKPLRPEHLVSAASRLLLQRSPFDDAAHVDHAVAVDIDDPYPLASDRHLTPGLCLKCRYILEATAHHVRAGCCSREGFDEISAAWHHVLPDSGSDGIATAQTLAPLSAEWKEGGRSHLSWRLPSLRPRFMNGPERDTRGLRTRRCASSGRASPSTTAPRIRTAHTRGSPKS